MDNHHVAFRAAILAALGIVAAFGLASCGGSSPGSALVTTQATTATPSDNPGAIAARQIPVVANTPMSRRLLSGRPVLPAGLTLQSLNPYVPTTQPPYGAVVGTVTSQTGVEYTLMFSPSTVPCVGQLGACASSLRTLTVGSANPSATGAVFSPLVGTDTAECGYDPDGHQVGCDALVGDEYVSVKSTSRKVSTADAVAVLRAAVAYVQQG
jgi:hypothetical protein